MSDDKQAPRDPFELCGVTIDGKYRVASVVGDGGFGVVYRGVHKGFGELIAVKCLKLPTEIETDEERDGLLERLREEGRLLHRLSRATPGIVQALDVGACVTPSGKWVPFLVLEWLEGETLGHWIRRRHTENKNGLPLREALAMLAPAARALAVAHAHKVAHRDVKPANLFITQVGDGETLKVLDFGIAKVLSDHGTLTAALEATALTPAAFTPRYGAPEQFNKQRGATGPWTDVFALALIFVELCTGEKALDGDDPTQLYIASADPSVRPTLRARGLDAPDAVERVLAKAVSVEPRHRYPEAGAFWDDLTAAVEGRAEEDKPTAPVVVSPRAQAQSAQGSEADPQPVSATVPAESLARRERLSIPDDDPMAETPAGRRSHVSSPSDAGVSGTQASPEADGPSRHATRPDRFREPLADPPPSRRFPWLLASFLVLIGGAAFAYFTFMGVAPDRPKPAPLSPSTADSRLAPPPPGPDPTSAPSASTLASAAEPAPLAPPPEDMVRITAGTFEMGTSKVEVTLDRDFFIDRYEVTVRGYRGCVEAGACGSADHVALAPDDPFDDRTAFAEAWNPRCNDPRSALDHPINCVTFDNAKKYCAFRGRRLPTEAEWELAARGTDERRYAWGTRAPRCEGACFDRNEGCLVPGQLVATCAGGTHASDRTPEGAYDLGGNVAEWTADVFDEALRGGTNPTGPKSGNERVVRGASFVDPQKLLVATTRQGMADNASHVTVGFRCALDAPDPAADAGTTSSDTGR